MAKLDSGTHVQEPCDGGRLGRLGADPQQTGRSPDVRGAAEVVSRGQQQQPLRLQGQLLRAAPEGFLDPARQRRGGGCREPHGQLGRRQSPGKLDQRQWIAARLGDDAGADSFPEWPADGAGKQFARLLVRQPFDHQFGQAREILAARSRREQQSDPVGEYAPRHERQRLRRRAIEPLGVVDDA